MEITCAIKEAGGEERSSWGKPASVTHFQNIYSELCQTVRQVLGLVDAVDQYDYFAGPRLKSLISHGNIVLIGDASHPLSGAFGAGAGFALEDAYTLGEAIGWAAARGRPYADALTVFDELRSPHYKALYDILDAYSDNEVKIARQNPTPEDEIRMRIKYNWNYSTSWFLAYDVSWPLYQQL